MVKDGFNKLYWGLLFIMVSFRLQGVDILPDVVGYILFAFGLSTLSEKSEHFNKARIFNIPMIVLSLFSIYEQPNTSGGINFGPLGAFGIIISIAVLALNLLIIYNILTGIKDMAELQEQHDISEESDRRWRQYIILQVAVAFAFVLIFIPPLALIYIFVLFVAAIVMAVIMMKFMKKCGENLY